MKRNRRSPSKIRKQPVRWRPALGVLALMPLLAACTTGGGGDLMPTETAGQSTGQTGAQTSPSPAPTTTSASASAEATSGSSGAPTPQVLEDACLDRCWHYETIDVTHPVLGPVQIRTYGWDMNPGSAPSQMQLAYAIYQDGQPIGFYEGFGNTYAFITTNTVMGNMVWSLEKGSNIDRYGNIYLATDRSVVVLAPTDTGYSQEGTLPAAPAQKPRFEIQPFFDEAGQPEAGLYLDAEGQARIVLGQDDAGMVRQVSILGPLGEDGAAIYTGCASTEPHCGFVFSR